MTNRFKFTTFGVILIILVSCLFLWIETLVLQWLLSVFGYQLGFWTCLGILFAVDFLLEVFKFGLTGKP